MAKFQKGKSGNPSGRPKGKKYVSEILKEMVGLKNIRISYIFNDGRKNEIQLKSSKEIGYLLAIAMIRKAIKGDVVTFREIMDRIEGKVASIDEKETDEKEINIKFGED